MGSSSSAVGAQKQMIVAGIGSRETPEGILRTMYLVGAFLVDQGDILRSGGAPGADQAFEHGATASIQDEDWIQAHAEIYLPWASFERSNRSWISARLTDPASWTYDIAAEHHPHWHGLSQGARRLHARNVHQVLGPSLSAPRTDAIICWTPKASGSGGTGQAIRIATAYDIPVFDLADPEVLRDVCDSFALA